MTLGYYHHILTPETTASYIARMELYRHIASTTIAVALNFILYGGAQHKLMSFIFIRTLCIDTII